MVVFANNERCLLKVSGPDATQLLHDVLTAKIEPVVGAAHWWALLSPQGKIQAEGLIGWANDAYWLDLHQSVADSFFKRMRLYKLRAAVDFEDLRDSYLVGWSPDTPEDNAWITHQDQRAKSMGTRVIAARDSAEKFVDDSSPWHAAMAANGIASVGHGFAADTYFPQDFGMDLLGGIDTEKGCYIGQEVVSRMKHRGTARRRPVLLTGAGDFAGPILCAGRKIGVAMPSVDGCATGIVRLDRVKNPADASVGDVAVTLAVPEWASYRFGESSKA